MLIRQEFPIRLFAVCGCICIASRLAQAYIADKSQVFNFKPEPQDTIWPLPRHQWAIPHSLKTLNPETFRFVAWPNNAIKECDIIRQALVRYSNLLRLDKDCAKYPELPELTFLSVTVKNYKGLHDCGFPSSKDDESYNLTINYNTPEASLISRTVWGMLRGLETFSQMIYQDYQTKACLVNVSKIEDWPKFAHRGILLDTARHFIPLKVIKKNLDAMSYNKMNVFHWHIVDDQSFPFQSKVYPNLTQLGAYSPKHVYKQEDIKDIIQYARLRGIRVIPEFDTPFHTRSIGKAFPDLLTKCTTPTDSQLFNGEKLVSPDGLNPSLEKTYHLVRDILQEFKKVFADEYVHLGMDESNVHCWVTNPDIIKFMSLNNITNAQMLEEHYARRVIKITQSLNYKYIIWEDPIENGVQVSSDTVVQIWKPEWLNRAWQLSNYKQRMILSSCWYVDLIEYGDQWEKFYNCDPLQFSRKEDDRNLMLGGEACLWAEYVDATNLLQTLWPSASAVAERLWNGDERLIADDETRRRFDQNRCRMLRRGIKTKPVYSGFCYGEITDEDDNMMKEQQRTGEITDVDNIIMKELSTETKMDPSLIYITVIASICVCLCLLKFSRTVCKPIMLKICTKKSTRRFGRVSTW